MLRKKKTKSGVAPRICTNQDKDMHQSHQSQTQLLLHSHARYIPVCVLQHGQADVRHRLAEEMEPFVGVPIPKQITLHNVHQALKFYLYVLHEETAADCDLTLRQANPILTASQQRVLRHK